jgi:hypothetical protein
MLEVGMDDWLAADALVEDWYTWSRGYFPDIWYPGLAPYCKAGGWSRQWDTTEEIAKEARERLLMTKVAVAIDELSTPHYSAIQNEMLKRRKAYEKNERAGAEVWRASAAAGLYVEAVDILVRKFGERGLFSD